MTYLDNFDNISCTNNFRIKLHMGFAGGEGHGSIGDAIGPRERGLYVVNAGSAGHPRDLQHRMTKIPLIHDQEDPLKGTGGAGLIGSHTSLSSFHSTFPRLWTPTSKPHVHGFHPEYSPRGFGDISNGSLQLRYRTQSQSPSRCQQTQASLSALIMVGFHKPLYTLSQLFNFCTPRCVSWCEKRESEVRHAISVIRIRQTRQFTLSSISNQHFPEY